MRRAILLLSLCSVLAGACGTAYLLTWRHGVSELQQNAQARADRYADSLKGTLERYELLPDLISLHPFVRELLLAPSDAGKVRRANDYLADIGRRAKVSAVYVIGTDGIALAASNWNRPDSFVGSSYTFRPYFQAAAHGGTGRFYGIGTTAGEPGYFVSQPVTAGGRVIGVVVVKLNLEWFQKADTEVLEPVVVADEHRVVFLSSVPGWQYHSLAPLTPAVRKTLETTRQYYTRRVTPLPLTVGERLDGHTEIVTIGAPGNARSYLASHRSLGEPDWELTSFAPLHPVVMNARIAAVAAGFAGGFACLLLFYWRQRRLRLRDMLRSRAVLQAAYDELEQRVADRTADLRAINERLQTEVQDRTRAESELRAAQSELVQASKLAALGQMAAGITHELNQPLAALRGFSDNARVLLERGEQDAVKENLSAIAALTERMGRITGQLRLFAGKTRPRDAHASVRRACDNTLALLHSRLKGIDATVEYAAPGDPYEVRCDGLKLEQVLTNLIGNAADAVESATDGGPPRIVVRVEGDDASVRVSVRDNGPGIAPDAMPRLFEPFFTTKEGGRGLGLGLAISTSIAREYGGQLDARNADANEGCGAEFILRLHRAAARDHGQDKHV